MKKYRFVGSGPCDIGGTAYERFGSRAEFSQELATQVLAGGGCFIPEADYQAIGITEAEAMQYAYAGGFPEPSAAFVAKRSQAQARARELMASPELLNEYHAEEKEN